MIPYLEMDDPAFSTRSGAVLEARHSSWCARTPYGLAVLRHREVGQLLRDKRLRQGSHDWPRRHGLTGPFTEFWEASVISERGARHKQLRDVVVPVLSEAFVESYAPRFQAIAQGLCADLRRRTNCEFMEDFAIPFAGMAVAVLLGLDEKDWRRISHDASDLGLAMGVECKAHERRINAACRRLKDLSAELVDKARRGHDPGGLVAQVVARHARVGGLDENDLLNILVILIFGGVDTTRSQLGLGLSLFIEAPEQWQALRADLSRVPAAVEEIIRQRPTTTWVTRQATEQFAFGDVVIEEGMTLHLLVHASATDPVVGGGSGFDITAARKSHFGFGGGAHHCIGHLVARTDMACALKELAETFQTVRFDGVPEWLPDSGNTSPVSLPIRYTLA